MCRVRFPTIFQWGKPIVKPSEAAVMVFAGLVALTEVSSSNLTYKNMYLPQTILLNLCCFGLSQSTGTFIAAARYASATPVPPSIVSRGAFWLV